MDTILASSSPSGSENAETMESMVIQQHDTVLNNSVKKDICSVTVVECQTVTPSEPHSEGQLADEPAQSEAIDATLNDTMEVEDQNVQAWSESTETSTLIPQAETADMDHEFITFKATDLVNTTELNVDAGTADHSTMIPQSDIDDMQPEATTIKVTEPMTTTESNIDAAISGDVKAEGAAANGYESSDLDSSDDEDEVTEKRVATADDSSSEDR